MSLETSFVCSLGSGPKTGPSEKTLRQERLVLKGIQAATSSLKDNEVTLIFFQ